MAEGAALEMRCTGNRTEGSNPSRSDDCNGWWWRCLGVIRSGVWSSMREDRVYGDAALGLADTGDPLGSSGRRQGCNYLSASRAWFRLDANVRTMRRDEAVDAHSSEGPDELVVGPVHHVASPDQSSKPFLLHASPAKSTLAPTAQPTN